jgi:hypothetical protein
MFYRSPFNYMALKRRYEKCNQKLLNDIFGFLNDVSNMDVALQTFEGTIYAHCFDVIERCMEGNTHLAEFVIHKIASDTCNEIATHAISAIPWNWMRNTTVVHIVRHSLLNNVRRFMPTGDDPTGFIAILNGLSGSISDNVKDPLSHYFREYCRAIRDGRNLQIPTTCFDAAVQYVKAIPPLAEFGDAIVKTAFYRTNRFAEENARLLFPTPQNHISRLPSQHVGEMSSVLARHYILDSAEDRLDPCLN